MPSMAPAGRASVYAEMSFLPAEPLFEQRAVSAAVKGMLACGLLKNRKELIAAYPARIPYAYVIYDRHRSAAVAHRPRR